MGCNSVLSGLGVVPIVAALCFAQQVSGVHPDFSGNWKLDQDKSWYSAHGGPFCTALRVQQRGNHYKEVLVKPGPLGDNELPELTYVVDGAEHTTRLGRENLKTSATWEGRSLIILWKSRRAGSEAQLKRTLALSQSGQTLVVEVYFRGETRQPDQQLLFQKNP